MADEGFLGRWSRRKQDVRQGRPADEPVRDAPPAQAPPTPGAAGADRVAPSAMADAMPVEPAPALSLDDVAQLTRDSDYSGFVARSVAPEVRNAAMRKLFSDPHFNVMDGLDIYIDDYTQPDPLPASMLKQMASAKFLRLVEDEPEVPAGAPPAGAQPVAEGSADGAAEQPRADVAEGDVAQSDACKDLPMSAPLAEPTGAPADAHPDLRLQPDDAARCEADRPGAA